MQRESWEAQQSNDDWDASTPDTRTLLRELNQLLTTPNESDSNGEIPNIVDGLYRIAASLHHVARAIEGKKPE